jgi:hypothetical protein
LLKVCHSSGSLLTEGPVPYVFIGSLMIHRTKARATGVFRHLYTFSLLFTTN